METRSVVLVAAGVTLILACALLAGGWMKVAEDATAETERCELRQRKRVADVARVTIGRNLMYGDEVIASVEEIQRGGWTIDGLYQRLKRDRQSDCDPSVVCLDNLIAVSVTTSVNNTIVEMILRTAWLADYDVVATPPPNPRAW